MIAAMEWFRDEFARSVHPSTPADLGTAPAQGAPPGQPVPPSSRGTEELHRDLDALVQSLSVFPVHRIFQLRDLDSPFLLIDILRAFCARATAFKTDRTLSEVERATSAPVLDAMVTRARRMTGRLDTMLSPPGILAPERLRLPHGVVLQRLISGR